MHPKLFELGHIPVYSYGFMMVVAYFFALGFVYLYAPKIRMNRNDAIDMSIIAFVSGILGARLVYVILNFKQYADDWSIIFEFQKGGLSWHGGVLGGVLAIIIYCKFKNYSIPKALDLILTPAIAGLGIGRIGCFLNGCCFGKSCSLPWAMTFPHHKHPHPVHPTQLYEMIMDFAAFIFLAFWWKKRKFNGENSLMMGAIYSVIRFIVEFFRYNTPNQMIYGLSLAQWVSVGVFSLLVPLILILRHNAKPMEDNEDMGSEEVIEDEQETVKEEPEGSDSSDENLSQSGNIA